MPDNPTSSAPQPATSSSAAAPAKAPTKTGADKYTPEQRAAAEEKVLQAAAKRNTEVDKFVDETAEKLIKFLEKEDVNTRTSVVDRIVQRVRSIKTVAANAKKYVARSAVMAEEKATMPRIVTGESRNIMAQEDQNKTNVNAGGDKK